MAESPKLIQQIIEAAKSLGAPVGPGDPALIGALFNLEIVGDVARATIGRQNNDLPSKIATLVIDEVPVLLGELDGPPVEPAVESLMRRYRNQATIARSWLGAQAPNLQLFLLGPAGALANPDWRQRAAKIEADDRTCRKLVWLFNGKPVLDDAKAFLSRTFVARPWSHTEQRVQLDAVATYSLPKGWEEAADEPELDNDGLVQRMIALEEKI